MSETVTIRDRYGIQISTSSPTAAQHYIAGVDLLLSQNFGPEEAFLEAIDADEGFALAHAELSMMQMMRAEMAEAKASAKRATDLSSGISRRELQHVEAVSAGFVGVRRVTAIGIRKFQVEFGPKEVNPEVLFRRQAEHSLVFFPLIALPLIRDLIDRFGRRIFFALRDCQDHFLCSAVSEVQCCPGVRWVTVARACTDFRWTGCKLPAARASRGLRPRQWWRRLSVVARCRF